MEEYKSKVYVRVDSGNRIIAIDGGYTIGNIKNIDEWILIAEGNGDRFNLCQSCFLDKPLMDDRGIYRYKLDGINPVERTQAEMDADYAHRPPEPPTQLDIIEAQTMYTALMTDTLLEG